MHKPGDFLPRSRRLLARSCVAAGLVSVALLVAAACLRGAADRPPAEAGRWVSPRRLRLPDRAVTPAGPTGLWAELAWSPTHNAFAASHRAWTAEAQANLTAFRCARPLAWAGGRVASTGCCSRSSG